MNQPTKLPHSITRETITVIVDGKSHVTVRASKMFDQLRQALEQKDWAKARALASPKLRAEAWAKNGFTIKGDAFYFGDEQVPSALNKRIMKLIEEEKSPNALLNFWRRLSKNPSKRSVDQLWGFLEHSGIPLTPSGHFLAYKGVKHDFYDKHSGKNLNKPGQRLSMARHRVSDDPREACHEGLHVGALSYAQDFGSGGRVVICKVDPKDVVCVPYDSRQQKMRVCAYEVVGLYTGQLPSDVYGVDGEDDEWLEDGDEWAEDGDDDIDADTGDDDVEVDEVESDAGTTSVTLRSKSGKTDLRAAAAAYHQKGQQKVLARTVFSGKVPRAYKSIHALSGDRLAERTMAELRLYATHGLKMVNAARVEGGKEGLIAAILAARA